MGMPARPMEAMPVVAAVTAKPAERPAMQSVNQVDAISKAAKDARTGRETNVKSERAFQAAANKKPQVIEDANNHLHNAGEGLKAKLAANERTLADLKAKADAAPNDADLQAEYDAAVLEHNANFTLLKSYEAAQVDTKPGHPTRRDAVDKSSMLKVHQQDLLAQMDNIDPNDPRHAEIAHQLTDVSISVYDLDSMVKREPSIKKRAARAIKVTVCGWFEIRNPDNAIDAQMFARNTLGQASISKDIQVAVARSLAENGGFPTPEADLVFAAATEANDRRGGVTAELRGAACDLLAAKRTAITSDAAKVEADKMAKAQRAEAARQVQPAVAAGEAKAPQAAATTAEAKKTGATVPEDAAAAQARAEREAFIKKNGVDAFNRLQKLGINFDGTTPDQILEQLAALPEGRLGGDFDTTSDLGRQLIDAAMQTNNDLVAARNGRATDPAKRENIINLPNNVAEAQAMVDGTADPGRKSRLAQLFQKRGFNVILAVSAVATAMGSAQGSSGEGI